LLFGSGNYFASLYKKLKSSADCRTATPVLVTEGLNPKNIPINIAR
jgi:hypothetical protein